MLLLTALALALAPADTSVLRQVAASLDSLPIERLDSLEARTVLRGAIVADLDGDGQQEAVVWIQPSLRQTPTLLLFREARAGGWARLREGLAPGRLRPLSGQLEDSHVHGAGVDLTAGDGSAEVNRQVLAAAASQNMSVVAYPGFLHADMRVNASFVVDLSEWTLPKGVEKTCERFEFSRPESVAFGRLEGGGAQQFLVVLSEEDVTIYRVEAISADGRLTLRSWMQPRAAGTSALERDASGVVRLTRRDGSSAFLALPTP
jgi:hypothetical protein